MAVAPTASWNPELVFICRQALINCGAIDENEEPAGTLYESARFQLNAMVKGLEATGLHVWAEKEAILFLQPGVQRYVIGGASATAHTSDADDWLLLTTLDAASATSTEITLQLGEGLLVEDGMNIGVVLSNGGPTQWTTVDGAPVGDVITLADALVGGVDAGAYVFAYTTPIERPLKVPAARLLTLQGLNETPMTIMSRQEYMDLPNKNSPGVPTQCFYSPQRDTGLFYIWTVPNYSNWAARFTWYRPLADFLLPTNTVDFPQEWINPLLWNLSKEMAPGYGVPTETWNRIEKMADTWAMLAISYDRESEPIQFGMDYPTGEP